MKCNHQRLGAGVGLQNNWRHKARGQTCHAGNAGVELVRVIKCLDCGYSWTTGDAPLAGLKRGR